MRRTGQRRHERAGFQIGEQVGVNLDAGHRPALRRDRRGERLPESAGRRADEHEPVADGRETVGIPVDQPGIGDVPERLRVAEERHEHAAVATPAFRVCREVRRT